MYHVTETGRAGFRACCRGGPVYVHMQLQLQQPRARWRSLQFHVNEKRREREKKKASNAPTGLCTASTEIAA